MLKVGSRIGKYVVEGKLGEGGTATVWRVREETHGSVHALKVLEVRSRQVRDRMLREGRLQHGLVHDHVVRLEDVLDIDGRPGLLLEYVHGTTLERWLERYRPSVDDALVVFRAICLGVGHAHLLGIVHRDLKPANVLMAVTADRVVPRVSDFGLAKSLDDDAGKTVAGRTLGTPAWMSPEQALDASSVDERTDLWALGAVLYRLTCGIQPFDGEDVAEVLDHVSHGRFLSSREVRPQLPERVHVAIENTLVVDPARRVADCGALLAFVDGLSDELPIGAIPDPRPRLSTEAPRWFRLTEPAGEAARAVAEQIDAELPKLEAPRRRGVAPPPVQVPVTAAALPSGPSAAAFGREDWLGLAAIPLALGWLVAAVVLSAVIAASPPPLELFHRAEAERHRHGPE